MSSFHAAKKQFTPLDKHTRTHARTHLHTCIHTSLLLFIVSSKNLAFKKTSYFLPQEITCHLPRLIWNVYTFALQHQLPGTKIVSIFGRCKKVKNHNLLSKQEMKHFLCLKFFNVFLVKHSLLYYHNPNFIRIIFPSTLKVKPRLEPTSRVMSPLLSSPNHEVSSYPMFIDRDCKALLTWATHFETNLTKMIHFLI